jgi:HSP20 family protein
MSYIIPVGRRSGRKRIQEVLAMALVRWNPLHELATMEVDRLNNMFSNFYGEGFSRGWVPPVDIYESNDHELVIKAELPDMKREDITVTFENNVLTLTGERKSEEIARERFQRLERFHGTFNRSFTLPATVDPANISANYKDGVLTVRLPQRAEAKPKQIVVGE